MREYELTWHTHHLSLGKRTRVMGILNVTPDSFSDGGHFFNIDDAVKQGEILFQEGADIVDIGGESTRPFSDAVSVEDEIRRVVPVIEALAKRLTIPISIDTTKAAVARRAIEAGASMINDISALRMDPAMAEVAVEYDVPIVLMHMQGTPKTMQANPSYTDLTGEIKAFLKDAIDTAIQQQIPASRVIVDPGIGFGKTFAQNFSLLKNLKDFASLQVPILIGPSRKAFLRHMLKDANSDDIRPDHPRVANGTQAAVAAAVFNGAHLVRVHDVAPTVATLKIIDAIKQAD